jgi:hypothetical protein
MLQPTPTRGGPPLSRPWRQGGDFDLPEVQEYTDGEKNPLAKPDKPGGKQNPKREHDVHVRGTIHTDLSPNEEKRHYTERKEDDAAHKAERKEDGGHETKKMWIEGLTLVGVVVYAGLAAWQGFLMRDAIQTQEKALNADQRAWIRPDYTFSSPPFPPPPTIPGTPISLPFSAVNTGKTPARSVETTVVIDIFTLDDHPSFGDYSDRVGTIMITNGLMFPQSPRGESVTASQGKNPSRAAKLTEETIQLLYQKKAYLAIYGQITYYDVMGHHHWVHFCGIGDNNNPTTNPTIHKPGDAALKCAEYNGVDPDIE